MGKCGREERERGRREGEKEREREKLMIITFHVTHIPHTRSL